MSAMAAWVLLFLVVGVISLAWGIYYTYAKRKAQRDRMFDEAIFASKRSFKNSRHSRRRR